MTGYSEWLIVIVLLIVSFIAARLNIPGLKQHSDKLTKDIIKKSVKKSRQAAPD